MSFIKNLVKKVWEKLFTKEIITYIIFGVLTTILSIVIYNLAIDAGFDVVLSNTISTVIAVLFAFITNKIWVFESRDFSVKKTGEELLKFSTGRFFTYLVETGLLLLLVETLHADKKISKYFTQIVIIVLNYIVSKLAVFRKK